MHLFCTSHSYIHKNLLYLHKYLGSAKNVKRVNLFSSSSPIRILFKWTFILKKSRNYFLFQQPACKSWILILLQSKSLPDHNSHFEWYRFFILHFFYLYFPWHWSINEARMHHCNTNRPIHETGFWTVSSFLTCSKRKSLQNLCKKVGLGVRFCIRWFQNRWKRICRKLDWTWCFLAWCPCAKWKASAFILSLFLDSVLLVM